MVVRFGHRPRLTCLLEYGSGFPSITASKFSPIISLFVRGRPSESLGKLSVDDTVSLFSSVVVIEREP